MTFKEWREENDHDIDTYNYPEESMESAWDAAIASLYTGNHWSDCALHNMPAMPNGPCDCGANAPDDNRRISNG